MWKLRQGAATAAGTDQFGRPFARKILRAAAVCLVNLETSAALSLLNARAVRERAHRMLAVGLEDKLPNFRIHLERMDSTVDLVLGTTRKAYPPLEVPYHSRWRHFGNRWATLANQTEWRDGAARARAEFDLAIISVFLDAGAGPSWRYHDPKTGSAIGRSEGLALASLATFAGGTHGHKAALDRLLQQWEDVQPGQYVALNFRKSHRVCNDRSS